MKLLIDKEYQNVDFFSFTKCTFFSQLAITILMWGVVALFLGLVVLFTA